MLGGGGDGAGSALVEEAEELLDPLTVERNVAWWDANVDATDERERRRAETELAYSNALADTELFAAVGSARTARTGSSAAGSTSCTT
jgi:hypothetical protein